MLQSDDIRGGVRGEAASAAGARAVRVCVISPLGYGLYKPDRAVPFGGAEVQQYLLATSLASDPRFDVTVLTTVDQPGQDERVGRMRLIARHGKGRLGAASTGGSMLRRAAGYAAAFGEMLGRLRRIDADIYIHAGGGPEVGAYALICRLLGRRFIFVVASTADLGGPGAQAGGPLSSLSGFGIRRAQAVVCRTREQQDMVRRQYGRDAIVISTAHPMPEASTPTGRCILWVGRVHPLKQPGLFLDLAERLPAHRHVMVAMRHPSHPDLFTEMRTRAGRLPNVEWLEDQPWSAMPALFARAAVLVNTSTYEGFPNTFVQAWMQGAPVVSWRVDPDGVLTKQGLGVCAGDSFDVMAVSVECLMRDESERTRIGRLAAQHAREHHGLDRALDAWKTLLVRMGDAR